MSGLKFLMICLFFCLFMGGCLRTHNQVFEDDFEKKTALEKKAPPVHLNKELSQIQQRLDLLERNTVQKQDVDVLFEQLEKKFTRLEDSFSALLSSMNQKTNSPAKPVPSLSLLDEAEQHFKNKNYKKAIFKYEEFRKAKPSSEKFKTATLKIGLSFMNLELKKEAQVFFKEVIDRFPDSQEAVQAGQQLKKL